MLLPSPDPLNFGEVWVGQVQLAQVMWMNLGKPVTVGSLIFLQSSTEFSVAPYVSPVDVAAAELFMVQIEFRPAREGPVRALVEPTLIGPEIRPGDELAPGIHLSGIGKARAEAGNISLGPGGYVPPIGPLGTNEPLDFGDIPVGGHRYKTVFIRNKGARSEDIEVKSLPKATGAFSVSEASGQPAKKKFTIKGNEGLYVIITFSPPSPGKFDEVAFFSADVANWAGISLTGRGHGGIG